LLSAPVKAAREVNEVSLKAKVGDLIQYRFVAGGGFAGRDTRRVELIDDNGYWVEGDHYVPFKNVLNVIPMHEEQPRTFPLEAGQ